MSHISAHADYRHEDYFFVFLPVPNRALRARWNGNAAISRCIPGQNFSIPLPPLRAGFWPWWESCIDAGRLWL
jgi:hypothetical protein